MLNFNTSSNIKKEKKFILLQGGNDHKGTHIRKPNQEQNVDCGGNINPSFASGNVEEGSVNIDLNDSKPNQEKSNEKNDHPSVFLGFETIARDTQEHKGNQQQEHDSNTVKVGHAMFAMIEEEFPGGFWISIKDGDSSNPPLRE